MIGTLLGMVLLLSACGSDYAHVIVGTWKEINQERYLRIEPVDEPGDPNAYRAILYAPGNRASNDKYNAITVANVSEHMNHRSMPANMQNGILNIQLEAGDMPVLYDPNRQQVVLNGTDTYQRVPEDIARLKLDTPRATNH